MSPSLTIAYDLGCFKTLKNKDVLDLFFYIHNLLYPLNVGVLAVPRATVSWQVFFPSFTVSIEARVIGFKPQVLSIWDPGYSSKSWPRERLLNSVSTGGYYHFKTCIGRYFSLLFFLKTCISIVLENYIQNLFIVYLYNHKIIDICIKYKRTQ